MTTETDKEERKRQLREELEALEKPPPESPLKEGIRPTDSGLPTIIAQFEGQNQVKFLIQWFNTPTESQLEIAGRELIGVAGRMRSLRLEDVVKKQPR